MGSGYHYASVFLELARREIQHRRRDNSDVGHVTARNQTRSKPVSEAFTTQANIPANDHFAAFAEEARKTRPNCGSRVFFQLFVEDASYVVGSE